MYVLLFMISYLCIFFARNRMPYKYMVYTLVLLSVYVIVSMINGWFYTFYPLKSDANWFYLTSLDAAQNTQSRLGFIFPLTHHSFWFSHQISRLYFVSKSILVGQAVSVIAYVASLPLLYAIIKRLSCEKFCIPILLIFSLHPIHLLNRVGFMRESWELLLFMLIFWFILNVFDGKRSIKNLLGLLIASCLGAKFHYIFKYIILVAVPVTFLVFYVLRMKSKAGRVFIFLLVAILIPVALVSVSPYLTKNYSVIIYQSHLGSTHTGYIASQGSDSVFFPLVLFYHYMASPLPWEVSNTVDLISFGCSFLRLILIYFAIKNIRVEKNDSIMLRKLALMVFCLSVALIYAQGVSSYGTAFRHQLLTYWGLVILGVPSLIESIKQKKYLFSTKRL